MIGMFLNALPIQTKIVAVAFIALALFIGACRVHDNIFQSGYDKRVSEEKELALKAEQEARVKIIEKDKKYAKVKKTTQSKEGREKPVSPVVGFSIDSLPND